MKKEYLYLGAGVAVAALLWMKSRNTSTSTNQSGAGGPPAWTQTSGPMGAKFDPVTGTLQMMPLYA
jgi:hypothetical protein